MIAGWRYGWKMRLYRAIRDNYRSADLLAVSSRWIAERLVSNGYLRAGESISSERLAFVPNGVDPAFIDLHRRLAVTAPFRFITVGRLVQQKRIDLLIEAAKRLTKHTTAFQLTVVGDGPLRESLQQQIDRAGLAEQVRLVGGVPSDRLGETLVAADGFLFTTEFEAFGLVVLEAMAVGLPVVAPRVGGLVEFISDEKTGFLYDFGDLDRLTHLMGRLMNDREEARQIGEAAKRFVAGTYTWPAIAERFEGLYRLAIERHG